MSGQKDEKWLDEMISRAVDCNTSQFDAEKWQRKYAEEAQMITTLGRQDNSDPIARRHKLGRTIMQSKWTKLAAAASIIIAVFLALQFSGNGEVFSSQAWGQMLGEMKQMQWVHAVSTIDGPNGQNTSENWTCFNPHIEVATTSGGSIHYKDYSKKKAYDWNAETNTISVYPITDKYNAPMPASVFEALPKFIENLDEDKTEISREMSTLDGKEVEIIQTTTKEGEFSHTYTLYRDTARNLLVRMDIAAVLPGSATRQVAHKASSKEPIGDTPPPDTVSYKSITRLDYPDEGPADLYALGVPADARIVDCCPAGNVEELLAIVDRQIEIGYGDHVAMVLQSWIEDDGRLTPSSIAMMRQKGQMQRMDMYFAGDSKRFDNLNEHVAEHWPNVTIDQVKKVERLNAIERQLIYDGKNTTIRLRSRGKLESNTHPQKIPFSEGDSLASLAWISPISFTFNRRGNDLHYELLQADAAHEGLVGLKVSKISKTVDDCYKIDECWLDPAKDYILIEHVKTWNKAGRFDKSLQKTKILQTRQNSDGRWYPAHIQFEWDYTDARGDHEQRIDKRIVFDFKPVLEDRVFSADHEFNPTK